jgi:hypothetical protein
MVDAEAIEYHLYVQLYFKIIRRINSVISCTIIMTLGSCILFISCHSDARKKSSREVGCFDFGKYALALIYETSQSRRTSLLIV